MPGGGPRLYRFFNYEQQQYIGPPLAGWNPDVSPSEMALTQAPVLDNFLIRPGKIVCRGGFSVWADLTVDAPLNVCGIHPHLGDNKILIGRKTPSATAFIDPWFAPIVRPVAAPSLAAANGTVLFAAGGTTITAQVVGGSKVPGPRGITFDGLRYYLAYGTGVSGAFLDVGSTYFTQGNPLCTVAGTTFTELTLAPHGAVDLKGYLSRLWLLGGMDTPGGGTLFDPLALFYTNPIANGGGALTADWQDPVSGLTNKIVMDGDSYDPGVALATARSALVIFRHSSIWVLRGTTTASFQLQPISREVGCVDPRSVVECDRGVYFLSHKGLMLTDGTSVTNVSGSVTQTIQNAIGIFMTNVLSSFGGYATCARVSDGQILVSIGITGTTSGVPDGHVQPVWSGLYNPETGAWTRLTSPIWAQDATILVPGNNYPGQVTTLSDGRLISVGDKYITQLEAPASASTAFLSQTCFAGAGADDASTGTAAWTNPSLITAEDGNDALATVPNGSTSHYLKSSSHGFTVPSNAVIAGIFLEVKRRSVFGSGNADNRVRLVKAGTVQATDKALAVPWGTPDSWIGYGGPTDMWAGAWTPADINSSGFGAAVSAKVTVGTSIPMQVDAIRITVYYSLGAPLGTVSFVQNPGLYDQMADGTFQPIPARWLTHLALLGAPFRNTIAKRIYMDYVFQGNGIAASGGWSMTPLNGDGTPYRPTVQVPLRAGSNTGSVSGGATRPVTLVQHYNKDITNEMTYLCFDVAWSDSVRNSAPSNVIPELYGIGVEFQKTSDER